MPRSEKIWLGNRARTLELVVEVFLTLEAKENKLIMGQGSSGGVLQMLKQSGRLSNISYNEVPFIGMLPKRPHPRHWMSPGAYSEFSSSRL